MDEIYNLVDNVTCITSIHKEFYKVMLNNRYKKIIKASYEKLKGGKGYE